MGRRPLIWTLKLKGSIRGYLSEVCWRVPRLARGRHHSVNLFASLSPGQRDEFRLRAVESGSGNEVFFSPREKKSRVKMRDVLSHWLSALFTHCLFHFPLSDSEIFILDLTTWYCWPKVCGQTCPELFFMLNHSDVCSYAHVVYVRTVHIRSYKFFKQIYMYKCDYGNFYF